MTDQLVVTRTCRYCGEDYPADEPELWTSTNQCRDCHKQSAREREALRREPVIKEPDPLIAPARVVVPWRKQAHMEYSAPTYDGVSSCDVCYSYDACCEHVQHGRPVMCEPIFRSDLRLAKAYMARKAEA